MLHTACCRLLLHTACFTLVVCCVHFCYTLHVVSVLFLSAAIVDEMLYMFHVFCILFLLPAACSKLHVVCFWLLTLWLHAAYSLPVLLVACHPLLAARYLPASAALWGDLPQSAQG